ncbi:MAG: DNA primase, partial [Pseudorhodobacter sp.]|nr:DNA primase [Frankiaceae bacterium]
FFEDNLRSPEAAVGRQFLAERGFDQAAAATYGVGFAPQGWDLLVNHLRGQGFSTEELITGGIASQGRSGAIDRFRYRLVWPIRDISGEVIGFGARKLSTDPKDDSPKYLNSPETPLYKKSNVLYGIDLAKKEIAKRRQAVVVEGYTDVMACHLAGVPTAVATCGTAFGSDHIAVIRRLLMDQSEFRGEVVFTFDGDAAGQKAALKAFGDDQSFVTQTFIAVSPGGMDPCELRLAKGDTAVRDLVAARVPLVEFAVKASIARFDLESAEGRVQALASAAPLVAKIKDRSLRPEYARRLAGWLGMEVEPVVARVSELSGDRGAPLQRRAVAPTSDATLLRLEREALKLAVQAPTTVTPIFDALDDDVLTDPELRRAHEAVRKAGGVGQGVAGEAWVGTLLDACADDTVRATVRALAVEAPFTDWELERYAEVTLTQLQMHAATRQVAELKGRLQRMNPVDQAELYSRTYAELIGLETTARAFRERGINGL